jgi:hypothetical protein
VLPGRRQRLALASVLLAVLFSVDRAMGKEPVVSLGLVPYPGRCVEAMLCVFGHSNSDILRGGMEEGVFQSSLVRPKEVCFSVQF